jgi:hypothetical protein
MQCASKSRRAILQWWRTLVVFLSFNRQDSIARIPEIPHGNHGLPNAVRGLPVLSHERIYLIGEYGTQLHPAAKGYHLGRRHTTASSRIFRSRMRLRRSGEILLQLKSDRAGWRAPTVVTRSDYQRLYTLISGGSILGVKVHSRHYNAQSDCHFYNQAA